MQPPLCFFYPVIHCNSFFFFLQRTFCNCLVMAAPAAAAAHQLALTSASPSQTSCTETNTLQAPPQGNPKVLPEVGETHNPFRKFWLYRRVLSQLNMPGKALWDLRAGSISISCLGLLGWQLSTPRTSSSTRGLRFPFSRCRNSRNSRRRSTISHLRILAAMVFAP